ncbi:DUF1330 domain-containing protein [Mycolicibacterium komossense]|uniref:DUF1330 domain-containing protein n=1 Tax=Mycolicibacterium komossense TaxID=1779 RepID=A0ABT3CIJ0_9MYCO|nr:DUF1330 domain-containing protein [Mycolicibacterium komossense]MCV7229167.1 DUF1330 domain-containing protein [Mycolicibacterium komossense]
MAKGYVVVTEDIKDPQGMQAYMAEVAKSVTPGIKILAIDPGAEFAEGDGKGQVVLMEFESLEAAKAWYFSEDYQKAVPLRQAAADCQLMIFSGF